jgi:plasmid stability protein
MNEFKEKTKKVITFPTDIKKDLKIIAAKQDKSMVQLISDILVDFVAEYKARLAI